MRKLRRLTRKQRKAFGQLQTATTALTELAEQSLGLTAQERAAAQDGRCELADMVRARFFELMELVQGSPGYYDPDRAEMEQLRGVGFIARVAATGTPAAEAVKAFTSEDMDLMQSAPSRWQAALGVLAFVLALCWPSAAKASERVSALARNAHKIQRRYFGRRARASYHRARGWIRSSRKSAGLRRLFTFSQSSGIGCGRELGSSKNRAKSSKSYWFGGAVASTLDGFPRVTPTSRFDGTTARSRARHTANPAAFRKMTTPTRWGAP